MSVLTDEDRAIVRDVARSFADPVTKAPAKVLWIKAANAAEEDVMGFERLGKLWKAREGSKAVATGPLKIDGREIRVGIFKNEKRAGKEGAKDADFEVLILPNREGGRR